MNRQPDFLDNLVLKKLIEDKEFFIKVFPHAKDKYFKQTDESRYLIKMIREYALKYKSPPSYDDIGTMTAINSDIRDKDAFKTFVKEQVQGLQFESNSTKYLLDTTEKHFQLKELTEAILRGAEMIQDPKQLDDRNKLLPMFREALAVELDRDLGMNFFSDESIEEQFKYYITPKRRIPLLHWPLYNKATGGGTYRQSLNILIAPPGIGKTMFLMNIGNQYLETGHNVLYITLEIQKNQIAERADANLMGHKTAEFPYLTHDDYVKQKKEIRDKVKGQMIIKGYAPGKASVSTIELLIDDLKNTIQFVPDVLIVDYIGLMKSDIMKNADELYTYKGSLSVELRSLITERDLIGWTASQTNRSVYKSKGDFEEDAIAESMVFLHTCDWMAGIVETVDLLKQGRMELKQMKSRLRDKNYLPRWPVKVDKDRQSIWEVPQDIIDKEFEDEARKKENAPTAPKVYTDRNVTKVFMKEEKQFVQSKHEIAENNPDLPPPILIDVELDNKSELDQAGDFFTKTETT